MKSLEYGKSGMEDIKHEGVFENKGWASLREEPFSGDKMMEEAERINETLKGIEVEDNNDLVMLEEKSGNLVPGTSANKEVAKEVPNQSVKKSIATLKEKLHDIFGSSSSRNQKSAANDSDNSRPSIPRTPPVETVVDAVGEPFYPTNYDDQQLEIQSESRTGKTEAEKEQIRKELAAITAQVREQLNQEHPNEPEVWHNETQDKQQEPSGKIDEIEQIQQSMNSDIFNIVKEIEHRRQSQQVPDFDWETNRRDPRYRSKWEEARQNVDNKIVDIEDVYSLGNEYYASVVDGGGGRTREKITKEQYELLRKQFPDSEN